MLTEAELFTVGSMVHDLAGLFHQESSLSVSLHLFISFLCSDFPRLFYCPAWRVIAWHHSGNQGVHVAGISKILTVHVHLIAFSVWYTLALNLPWSCSPETLFCSLQKKINLKSFSRLGMGNCVAVPIWEGDLVVCPRNNFLPILSIWDRPHLTPTPRHRCISSLHYVDESVGFSHFWSIFSFLRSIR